jgi:hypothetical protein
VLFVLERYPLRRGRLGLDFGGESDTLENIHLKDRKGDGMDGCYSNREFRTFPTECIYGLYMIFTVNSSHFLKQH